MEAIEAIGEADNSESKLKYFDNGGRIKDGYAATFSDRAISNGKVSTSVTKINSLSKGSDANEYSRGYHIMGDGISGMRIGDSLDSITIYKLVKIEESIKEADVHPSEDHWPHDKPYPKTPPVSADLANDAVDGHLERAAQALAKDAIQQAAGVYDEEGPGEGKFATGAQSQDEYVRIAAKRFLDKDYKKAILVNFQKHYADWVDYWLDET